MPRDLNSGWLGNASGRGLLASLRPELIEQLVGSASPIRYPKHSNLYLDGSPNAALVLGGLLRCCLAAPDGRQVTIRYARPGDLVVPLPGRHTLDIRVEVVEPADVIHLDFARIRALAAIHPEVALALHDEAWRRLPDAIGALAASAFLTVRSRVARDLVARAQMRGTLRSGVRLYVTNQELADATGSVREVVARAIQRLRQDGMIATNTGAITILDPESLADAAGIELAA